MRKVKLEHIASKIKSEEVRKEIDLNEFAKELSEIANFGDDSLKPMNNSYMDAKTKKTLDNMHVYISNRDYIK